MKLKIMAIAAIVVISVVSAAGSYGTNQDSKAKKSTPVGIQPTPTPTIPDFPDFPPVDPTVPTIPDIPPPRPDGGPEVPFPMTTTLPFPWGNIEGIWKVEVTGVHLLFSFKVETDYNGKQFLSVLQVDYSSGAVLAEGVGISVENDKLVRAAMTTKSSLANSYMLFIGSYKNEEGISLHGQASRTITVLTVRSFSDLLGDKDVQVAITKVSNRPYQTLMKTKSLPKLGVTY